MPPFWAEKSTRHRIEGGDLCADDIFQVIVKQVHHQPGSFIGQECGSIPFIPQPADRFMHAEAQSLPGKELEHFPII